MPSQTLNHVRGAFAMMYHAPTFVLFIALFHIVLGTKGIDEDSGKWCTFPLILFIDKYGVHSRMNTYIAHTFILYVYILFHTARTDVHITFSAGLRTGQTGQLPRGLHKKGPPQKHFFLNKYMAVSYSVCHRGLLVNVCKFHFNYAFYTEVNG